MTDLKGVIELFRDFGEVVVAFTAIIVAITGTLTAMAVLAGKLTELWEKVLKPLWNKILGPFSKFVAKSLTLIVPSGSIIWAFVYWVAEDLTPIIKEPEVFLFVVTWLTLSVSAYSLLWGMWFYPNIIRPLFNKRRTKKPAKENKVNENEVDEDKSQSPSVQSQM